VSIFFRVFYLMGQRSTKELLNRIKDNNDTHHKILQLFRKYDQDRSGYLEGPEYAAFVDALATYIVEGLAHEGVAVHPSVVRLWLKPTLDITRDGRLSFEEVENNLHTALAASLSPSLRHLMMPTNSYDPSDHCRHRHNLHGVGDRAEKGRFQVSSCMYPSHFIVDFVAIYVCIGFHCSSRHPPVTMVQPLPAVRPSFTHRLPHPSGCCPFSLLYPV